MKSFKKLLVATALSASLVLAQRPERGPMDPAEMIEMRVDHLATRLTLTDAQKTQATKIFTDAQAASTNARTSMQETRTSIAAAVKTNDTGAIDRLAITAGSLSGQITAIESKAEAAFYSILTADQKTKHDTTRGRGPGGPGGPGFRGPQGFGQGR